MFSIRTNLAIYKRTYAAIGGVFHFLIFPFYVLLNFKILLFITYGGIHIHY